MKKIIYILLFLSLGLSAQQANNTKKGSTGLSALFQGSQFGIAVPYWTSEKFAIIPNLSIIHVSDIASDISLGSGFRFYKKRNQSLYSYFAINTAILANFPSTGSSLFDAQLGIGYGGEYFLSDNFSFGIEAQLNAALSDDNSNRFNNPGGYTINTSALLFATIYF